VTKLRNGRSGVQIPAGSRNFYILQIVRIDFGAHQASYLMDTGFVSRQECEGVDSNLHLMLRLEIRTTGKVLNSSQLCTEHSVQNLYFSLCGLSIINS
jgi:hypothetical protein